MSKSSQLTIAYVAPVALPKGGAAARRMLGIARSLHHAGFRVIFGSGQMPTNPSANTSDFNGFEVHSLSERDSEGLPTWLKHIHYIFMGRKTRKWLKELEPKPDAVIFYSGYLSYFIYLTGWCKKNKIPLIFDSVEWYDPGSMPGGRFGLYRISFEIAMRWNSIKNGNIIAISKYLENYFLLKNCRVMRIPPTIDFENFPPLIPKPDSGTRSFAYCGQPGKKDRLDIIIEAFFEIYERRQNIVLNIAGITEEEFFRMQPLLIRNISTVPDFIKLHGELQHRAALELIGSVDFTVLIRYNEKFSQAGFPTKVVESLAVGTPIIANLTSDLGDFLINEENSLICKGPTVDDLVDKLIIAVHTPKYKLKIMSRNARSTA
ncbi:MAG: glycosyltransferase, partial [bacterium]